MQYALLSIVLLLIVYIFYYCLLLLFYYYYILNECWCMLDVFKFCFKHEQCKIHWSTLYCYSLYPYLTHFIVHWMNFLHGCFICVMIVSFAHYVSDLFQHWLEHLFDDWHLSISIVCELVSHLWLELCEYNKYNTIHYSILKCTQEWLVSVVLQDKNKYAYWSSKGKKVYL
jgi:hypothetical protein